MRLIRNSARRSRPPEDLLCCCEEGAQELDEAVLGDARVIHCDLDHLADGQEEGAVAHGPEGP